MSHEPSALVPSNYNDLPREANKTNDSTFDRIYKYYHNNKTRIELSPTEDRIRERLEKAWYLLCRHRTSKQVVDILEKLFGVKKSVAFDDVRNAMMLFGNPQQDVKEAKRAIAESMALRGADRCWKTGDMVGYNGFMKEYIKINKLEIQEDDLNSLVKNLRPTQIILFSKKAELEKEADEIQNQLIQDIEYTDADEREDSKD